MKSPKQYMKGVICGRRLEHSQVEIADGPLEIDVATLKLIPEGEYTMVCTHVEKRVSRTTERVFWVGTWVVAEGPYTGFVLYHSYSDVPKARWVYIEVADHPKELEGMRVNARVTHSVYDERRMLQAGRLQSPRWVVPNTINLEFCWECGALGTGANLCSHEGRRETYTYRREDA